MSGPRYHLLLILIVNVVGSAMQPFLPVDPGPFQATNVAVGLVSAGLLFAWCKADARARGISLPGGSAILVGLVSPIGVPLYYFRTLPWRLAAVATGKAILYLLLVVILSTGAGYASHAATT